MINHFSCACRLHITDISLCVLELYECVAHTDKDALKLTQALQMCT